MIIMWSLSLFVLNNWIALSLALAVSLFSAVLCSYAVCFVKFDFEFEFRCALVCTHKHTLCPFSALLEIRHVYRVYANAVLNLEYLIMHLLFFSYSWCYSALTHSLNHSFALSLSTHTKTHTYERELLARHSLSAEYISANFLNE